MDNTVIFPNQQPPKPSSLPSSPPQNTPPPQKPPPPLGAPPVSPPSPPPPQPGMGALGILLRVGIGLVALSLIGALIFFVIMPMFESKPQKNAKLVYWGLWEDSKVMDAVISNFEREHPNIKVEYVKKSPKQYREQLLTRIDNGTGPDIFRYHNTWYPMLSGVLLPLSSDVIRPDDFKRLYYPVMQQDLMKNGAIYGIPLHIDTLSLFVNTAILQASGEKAPTNWNEFINVAKATTTPNDAGQIKTAGAALGTMNNVRHAPDIVSVLLHQSGASLATPSATLESTSDALEFYTSFATGAQNVWDETLDPSLLAFSKENLTMYFGYSWDIFELYALNPKLQYKVYPVPILPGGKPMTLASYWVEGVSVKSPNQKEALQFMNYLTKKETLQNFYKASAVSRPEGVQFGELYPRVDMASLLKDNSLIYPFVEQARVAKSSFFTGETQDGDTGINAKMNKYLTKAVDSILQNTSTPTAVETLAQGVSQVLQSYGQQL